MKRARWGPLLLLALAASPLLALVLLAVVVILFRPFRKKEYGHPAMTLQGEAVRSGAEKRVADWLFLRGIRYEYERPAFDRSGRVISRPDFYLPDLGVYVEYWGLVGKSRGYEDSMMRKMELYRRNGVRVASLYPDDLGGLDRAFGRNGFYHRSWPAKRCR